MENKRILCQQKCCQPGPKGTEMGRNEGSKTEGRAPDAEAREDDCRSRKRESTGGGVVCGRIWCISHLLGENLSCCNNPHLMT